MVHHSFDSHVFGGTEFENYFKFYALLGIILKPLIAKYWAVQQKCALQM
jgi:hypothetical protein